MENKTTYTLEIAEMNIFETHQVAERVWLNFDQPVLASMIKGKKVMHLGEKDPFPFLPGESLMLPREEWMNIDFPEANLTNPTQCLAMTISEEKMQEVLSIMNEQNPKVDYGEWKFYNGSFHFSDDQVVYKILHRLIYLCVEDHPSKDIFADMTIKELLIRLLQAESRNFLVEHAGQLKTHHRIGFIIDYIKKNIQEKLTIPQLSQKACMSESHFFRVFKNELGLSPIDFINEERLKLAARLLKDPRVKVGEVCMACGFNSISYFNRAFKKRYGHSPKAFQKQTGNMA